LKRTYLGLALAALLLPLEAWGEVKVTRRPDGTLLMYNLGTAARPASAPLKLREAPDPQWSEWIEDHAGRQRLDSRLVLAVIQVESGFDARAVSRKGAQGLMQLMPDTARLLRVPDPFDPRENIRGGTSYLRQMLDLFDERLELALAAYNAGPGAVRRHGGIPPFEETREYVRRVLTLYRGAPQELPRVSIRPAHEVQVRRVSDSGLVMTTALPVR
jgi:soluble lytic murein transglycosylase-like protein